MCTVGSNDGCPGVCGIYKLKRISNLRNTGYERRQRPFLRNISRHICASSRLGGVSPPPFRCRNGACATCRTARVRHGLRATVQGRAQHEVTFRTTKSARRTSGTGVHLRTLQHRCGTFSRTTRLPARFRETGIAT